MMVKHGTKIGGDQTSNEDINYKHVTNRIDRIQKHCGDLAKVLAGYATKSSIIRDKNDEIANCLAKYTKVEDFNTTSKLAMTIASELFAKVGDHQTTAVQRLETKVLPNFSSYGRICKCLKGDIRNATAAQERVLSRRKMATAFSERMNEPKYRDVITDAERDLENAMAESSRLSLLSQEQVIKFEHKRLIDLKETLESFFKIEIARHAKSLELLTEAYKYIHSIDEDADLEALKGGLKLQEIQSLKPFSENKSKPPKNTKTADYKAVESAEEDNSWNSDLVRKLEEMMNSQPRRSATKITRTSNEKDSSGHIGSRKKSTTKSGSTNAATFTNHYPPESSHSGTETRNYEGKDGKQRKEKVRVAESFSSRESLQEASRTASGSVIANTKESSRQEKTVRRPHSSKSVVSNTSYSNSKSMNDQDDHYVEVKQGMERKMSRHYNQAETTVGVSGKKVSFHEDDRDRNEFDRTKDMGKKLQVASKQQPEPHYVKKLTVSNKFTPTKAHSKNQFL